jgi:FAD/FMN-containing dehydrogenase/Fe-S oxidoreductase
MRAFPFLINFHYNLYMNRSDTFSGAEKDSPIEDLSQALRKAIRGEVRTDLTARLLYSTDASNYQIEPLGVVFPKDLDEINAAMEISASYGVPVLARGAGSSLAGQAIGPALILDCSRYLTKILSIDPQARTATVEPGVVLDRLNLAAQQHGLQFGPDPASAERATMGGSLANNATGSHSILYGMAADHLLSTQVVLSDGSQATFETISLDEARRKAGMDRGQAPVNSREQALYRASLEIRQKYANVIRQNWPRTWRRASGYNLNYLLHWSPSEPAQWRSYRPEGKWDIYYPPVPPDGLNLAPLVAGSEGTLAIIREATIALVPLPQETVLGVLAFDSVAQACDAVPEILQHGPSSVELIPQIMIRAARSVPAYARLCGFVDELAAGGDDPAALLAVEFSGDNIPYLREQVQALGSDVLLAETPQQQEQVWTVRKEGLGLLLSAVGNVKPWPSIEDLAVPIERLGEFVRQMEHIMREHGTQAYFFAHASAGCLHIRPLLSLKDAKGIATMRAIAEQAVALVISLGGSVSGEHGDGLARSEWLQDLFGEEIVQAFRDLKQAADPDWLLNPGKIVSQTPEKRLPRMDSNLRFGPDYHSQAWQPRLDFSRQAGLDGAIEQCNGAGVCRKSDGVMCPSFQATQDEMHSTRGRANLLRAMISGRFPDQRQAEKTVYEALDLCLACKGCKAECPSTVDVAKLKYEFLDHYYQHHTRRLRDYVFAYIDLLASLGSRLARLANWLTTSQQLSGLRERGLGLSDQRALPALASQSFSRQLGAREERTAQPVQAGEQVLLLMDAFNEYFYPQVGMAAVQVLEACGCRVQVLPVMGAGRTLISKGFIQPAKKHAARLLGAVEKLDPNGEMAVLGLEPSEIYTLRDEYFDLLPGEAQVAALAKRAYMIDEYLIRPANGEGARLADAVARQGSDLDQEEAPSGEAREAKVLLHGHCYQKAQPPAADGYATGVPATRRMLESAGYRVEVIDSGCCGMAGAFGYEAEHFDVSMDVGELKLLPAVRQAASGTLVAASGVSCQSQIEDGAGRSASHPIELVAAKLTR